MRNKIRHQRRGVQQSSTKYRTRFRRSLAHVHNRVEGKNEYNSLLYIPGRARLICGTREQKHGVKLYVRRVFIMDRGGQVDARYLVCQRRGGFRRPAAQCLRSCCSIQKIDSIRSANVKRVLGLLEKIAKQRTG